MPTALVIVLVAAAIVLLWAVVAYNRLVALRTEAGAALANVDAQLVRRADLVPALVEVVRGHAGHEATTMEAVTRARAATVSASTPHELAAASVLMDDVIGQVVGLAEGYPELRASEGFGQLQRQLAQTEDKLAVARGMYNVVVGRYNTRCQQLPSSVVASLGGFRLLDYVGVDDAGQRDAATVDLQAGGAA